jgi:hypothetical protein
LLQRKHNVPAGFPDEFAKFLWSITPQVNYQPERPRKAASFGLAIGLLVHPKKENRVKVKRNFAILDSG